MLESRITRRLRASLRGLTQRHWRRWLRWREAFRFTEEATHLVLAGCVGVIGGLTQLVFVAGQRFFQAALWHQVDGQLVAGAEGSSAWYVILVPCAGGLAAGAVLYFGLHLVVGSNRESGFLEAVVMGDGRLPFRAALVKGLSSFLSIGTGASVGKEGLIAQVTAALASKWGQLLKWQPYRLRLLVACGAGGGMAAAYNAPIAGAVFAAHIVLGNFSMNVFAPLVFATVVATVVTRSFFGIHTLYELPGVDFSLVQLPWYLVVGVCCGIMGGLFIKALRLSKKAFQGLNLPRYAKMAIGGLVVGLLAVQVRGVLGNGYAATNEILHGHIGLKAMVLLVASRFAATVIAVGSGALGGVFTPTLFLGSAVGGIFGQGLSLLPWAPALSLGAVSLVGMGGVLAATTHSALLAMIMIFELSLNYTLMPPLMLVCAVAMLVARRIEPVNVYSESLEAKGLERAWESERIGAASRERVGDMMRAPVAPVRENTGFEAIAERFLTSPYHFLPVVDAEGRLIGAVALEDLKEYLNMGDALASVIAYDVMRPAPASLMPRQRLEEALPVLLASELRHVPVVNNYSENKLVGSLVRAEALGWLSEAIAPRAAGIRG